METCFGTPSSVPRHGGTWPGARAVAGVRSAQSSRETDGHMTQGGTRRRAQGRAEPEGRARGKAPLRDGSAIWLRRAAPGEGSAPSRSGRRAHPRRRGFGGEPPAGRAAIGQTVGAQPAEGASEQLGPVVGVVDRLISERQVDDAGAGGGVGSADRRNAVAPVVVDRVRVGAVRCDPILQLLVVGAVPAGDVEGEPVGDRVPGNALQLDDVGLSGIGRVQVGLVERGGGVDAEPVVEVPADEG